MFINDMKDVMNSSENFNYNTTENGAGAYEHTNSKLLDLNFSITGMRNMPEDEICKKFMEAYFESPEMAIKWLFYSRDIRFGIGERRTFRAILRYLGNVYPHKIANLIKYIPEYGRWDDMLVLLHSPVEYIVFRIIKEQLTKDLNDMKLNKNISLLAKWCPSINASSKVTIAYGKYLAKNLGLTEREYRKTLSKLRAYIDVTEVKMSNNRWGEINYSTVPSRANIIYACSFLRNDRSRREEFLNNLKNGNNNVKINSSDVFPYEIFNKYLGKSYFSRRNTNKYDETLEQMWRHLPNKSTENVMVVSDGSGSMTTKINRSSYAEYIDVSNSLAVYFAEHSSGQFKDKFITFSIDPKIVDMSNCKTLQEKIDLAYINNDYSNTNIEAVFKLILKTALSKNMSQDEMPKTILIISDMQFDAHSMKWENSGRLFDIIKKDYEDNGYKLPKLVFWNVCGYISNTIPLIKNDLGVLLISGFSNNLLDMVMSNKLDPYEALVEKLKSIRYKQITLN